MSGTWCLPLLQGPRSCQHSTSQRPSQKTLQVGVVLVKGCPGPVVALWLHWCGEGGLEGLLPVDEVFLLQVLHGGRDLSGHVQQHHSIHLLPITVPQVVQQVPIGHELSDYVERGLPGADPCQRDQGFSVPLRSQQNTHQKRWALKNQASETDSHSAPMSWAHVLRWLHALVGWDYVPTGGTWPLFFLPLKPMSFNRKEAATEFKSRGRATSNTLNHHR